MGKRIFEGFEGREFFGKRIFEEESRLAPSAFGSGDPRRGVRG